MIHRGLVVGLADPPLGLDALKAEVGLSIPKVVKLLESVGFDASPYKASLLESWVVQRMLNLDVHAVGDYVSWLQSNDGELSATVDHVLNGTTSFLRDGRMWKRLERVLDRFLDSWPKDRPLRVWNPACSTGEESYSIAMVVEQAMTRRALPPDYVVFASDINGSAISFARRGSYSTREIAGVSTDLLARFFCCDEDGYFPCPSVREAVIFARQDIFTDLPISRVDLIVCRNLFIYLRPNYRHWLSSLFHYALRPGGVLFLGTADAIGQGAGFSAVDDSRNIYSRAPGASNVSAVLTGPAGATTNRRAGERTVMPESVACPPVLPETRARGVR